MSTWFPPLPGDQPNENVTEAGRFIPIGSTEAETPEAERDERYLPIEPGTGQLWVWIERTADPDDDRGPDLYLGPFPKGSEHLAEVCMNESLLIEGELMPPLGGTDCQVVSEDPDTSRSMVVLIDHNDPNHTGYDRAATCRHCGHGIVRLANRDDDQWIAPDAGYDSVDGDGIWRETCPDVEWPATEHEPEEAR